MDERPEEAERPRVPVRLEEAAGAIAMTALCAISFLNVLVRYLTDISFAFTEEYSVFLLVVMTFAGAALAFATDGHVRITVLEDHLPPAGRLACRLLAATATTVVLGLVIWHGAFLALDQWEFEETSPGLGYPQWLYTMWLPVLALGCLVRAWGALWRRLRRGA